MASIANSEKIGSCIARSSKKRVSFGFFSAIRSFIIFRRYLFSKWRFTLSVFNWNFNSFEILIVHNFWKLPFRAYCLRLRLPRSLPALEWPYVYVWAWARSSVCVFWSKAPHSMEQDIAGICTSTVLYRIQRKFSDFALFLHLKQEPFALPAYVFSVFLSFWKISYESNKSFLASEGNIFVEFEEILNICRQCCVTVQFLLV